MGLEDLNEKLYSRDQAEEPVKIENPYEPDLAQNLAKHNISHLEMDGESWAPVHHQKTFQEKLSFWWADHQRQAYIIGGIAVFLAVVGGASWYWYQQFFSERNTVISIVAEEQVKSGEQVTPTVVIRNENHTSLENVKIIIELPQGFVASVPVDGWNIQGNRAEKLVGAVARDQEVKASLPGKIFGNKGSIALFKGMAEYTPAKVSGVYEVSAEAKTVILSSPLTLQVTGPQELVTGQELEYEVIYKNESNETFDNVRLKAFFPPGFSFKSSNPGTNSFDTWFLNTFRPGDTAKIVVRGSLEGAWNETKEARFALGYESGAGEFVSYNEGTTSTKIIASPLSIKQVVNQGNTNAVTPGTILSYDIQYQNNSNQGYRDVIVSVNFDNPEFLDWANLDLPQGTYNQSTKTISWRTSEVPELRALAPGAIGNLTFNIPVIADFSNAGTIKNKAIISKATIDSPDIQSTLSENKLIGSSTSSIALGTLVGFQISAYHEDSVIETDGPLPPESGEKTEYVLRLQVSNPANDVTQGKAVVALPGYMKFTGKKSPDDGSISYNERTNEISWTIGTLNPGTRKEMRVQTEFAPGDDMKGKSFQMFQSALFTGFENFTKQNISLPLESKGNALSDEEKSLPPDYTKVKR